MDVMAGCILYSVVAMGGQKVPGVKNRGAETWTGTKRIRKTQRERNVFTIPNWSLKTGQSNALASPPGQPAVKTVTHGTGSSLAYERCHSV